MLDYLNSQHYYKIIYIDLSRQTNTSISQPINFAEGLEEDDDAIMFSIAGKEQKGILNFSLYLLVVTE